MKTTQWLTVILLSIFVTGFGLAAETPSRPASATFVVGCYDVGADALSGKPGVLGVERGWRNGREINRVSYDPQAVSLPQLQEWVRDAGTYIETMPPADTGTAKETKP